MLTFDELFALNKAAAGRLHAVAEPAVPFTAEAPAAVPYAAEAPSAVSYTAEAPGAVSYAAEAPAAVSYAAESSAAVPYSGASARPEGRAGVLPASGWSTQSSTVPGRFSYIVNSVHPVPSQVPRKSQKT